MKRARHKALALSLFTVLYNLAEGGIAMTASAQSGSSALWGFGLDSFVESLSGLVMVWRFAKFEIDSGDEEFEAIERRSARLVAYSFFALGAYVVLDASYALYAREAPESSVLGMALAVASLVVMPVLFLLKYRLGKSIGSRSLVADSKETLACLLLSVALLAGLAANWLWRLWWVDAASALVIAALILREGWETLTED